MFPTVKHQWICRILPSLPQSGVCNSKPPPVGNREGKEEDADGEDEGVHAELVLGRRAGGAVAAAAAVALFYCALHLRARRARLEAHAQVSCCHACARRGSYFFGF